jgi:hypothetical protein
MKMKSHIFLSIVLLASLSACGPGGRSTSAEPRLYEEMRVSDIVKHISTDIKSSTDERSFEQQYYKVGPNDRLLIMYSTLTSQADRINTADGGKVLFEINLEKVADSARASSSVKLCPITAKWMMLATWERAFPRKKWENPGGDYDADGCITPSLTKPSVTITPTKKQSSNDSDIRPVTTPTPTPTPEPVADGTLFFDITRWYLDYPKGRNINLGWVLISSQEMQVMGDRSGSRSPRLYWYERSDTFRTYYQFGQ